MIINFIPTCQTKARWSFTSVCLVEGTHIFIGTLKLNYILTLLIYNVNDAAIVVLISSIRRSSSILFPPRYAATSYAATFLNSLGRSVSCVVFPL